MSDRPSARSVTPIARYAAIGDSLSAGTAGDPWAPWPRVLADMLERGTGRLHIALLARVGSTASQVHGDQVPAALRWAPDLVTVTSGANDVLHSFRPDIAAAGAALEHTLEALRARLPAERVLVLTYPPFVHLPYRPRSKLRVLDAMRRLNDEVRASARRSGAQLVDLERHPRATLPDGVCADGIHPSPIGHRRIALYVRTIIGEAHLADHPATDAGAPTIPPMTASRSPETPERFT